MTYMQRLFHRSVLRSEMIVSWFMTLAYMAPLVIMENLWYYVILTKSNLDSEGGVLHSTLAISWGYRLLSSFVRVSQFSHESQCRSFWNGHNGWVVAQNEPSSLQTTPRHPAQLLTGLSSSWIL